MRKEIRDPSGGRTNGIHLVQEDHCSQLSIVCCQKLAALSEVS
jgi:hypothetical protein